MVFIVYEAFLICSNFMLQHLLKLLTVLSQSCFVTKVLNSSMGLHVIVLGQTSSFTFLLDGFMGILCFSYCLSSKIMGMRMYHDTAFSFPFAALSEWRGRGSYHMVINNAPSILLGYSTQWLLHGLLSKETFPLECILLSSPVHLRININGTCFQICAQVPSPSLVNLIAGRSPRGCDSNLVRREHDNIKLSKT